MRYQLIGGYFGVRAPCGTINAHRIDNVFHFLAIHGVKKEYNCYYYYYCSVSYRRRS
jgi:hypothetical protein